MFISFLEIYKHIMLETIMDDYGQFIDLETVEEVPYKQKHNHKCYEYKPNEYYNDDYSIYIIRIISWITITYMLYKTIYR